ncbi:hypothetical protein [Exiguobacterium sp.]|uniref:hypothetical protein n=1 Tax=Exiguobacterium sp. TaxID=44751 RepID=UPI00263AB855|nr:hypothetical protein [Exiguobacterium sp.]MCC5891123.1 hypothetical protein [Exiguobacterium sp.]
MKSLFGFMLFLLAMSGGVAVTAWAFGNEAVPLAYDEFYEDDVPLATSIDAELEDIPETFGVISEVFDTPIAATAVDAIQQQVSDPSLQEAILHPLGEIDVMFEGRPTTLTVEAEVYREDGTYILFYFTSDEDVVLALDDRIMAYYDELGI